MTYIQVPDIVTSLVVALFTIAVKLFFSRYISGRVTSENNIIFMDKIINDLNWKKRENRIIIEKAFEHIYRKQISFGEIKLLIFSEMPDNAFRVYLRYRSSLEINQFKTQFKFKSGGRPYWIFFNKKIPKKAPIGMALYLLFGVPASYGMTWLIDSGFDKANVWSNVIGWFFVILFWFVAIAAFLEGLKYQGSEKELIKHLGRTFEIPAS